MIPYFSWTTIPLGPLTIQVWGLFVASGILLSLFILRARAKKRGDDPTIILDLAFWLLIGGFIGARLAHVFLYEPSYYFANPAEILQIWHGGLSSFGGLFGAVAAFFLFLRRKKMSVARAIFFAQEVAFASLFGWMVGRIGCAMIHDHWGILSNIPFAIATPPFANGGGRLDMAILEILGLIPLALLFFVKRNEQSFSQKFLSIIFVYYGILRFILDFFRARDIAGADVRYLGLTPGQFFAMLLVAIGLFVLLHKQKNYPVFL